jgi:phage I-like protein
MIDDTIAKIEGRLKRINSIKEENKTQLLKLLSTLKSEVEELSKTQGEKAESILNFTTISTHEATRQDMDKNPQLLQLSLEGLSSSVEGFEASHPTLVGTVNAICVMLSNLGI